MWVDIISVSRSEQRDLYVMRSMHGVQYKPLRGQRAQVFLKTLHNRIDAVESLRHRDVNRASEKLRIRDCSALED